MRARRGLRRGSGAGEEAADSVGDETSRSRSTSAPSSTVCSSVASSSSSSVTERDMKRGLRRAERGAAPLALLMLRRDASVADVSGPDMLYSDSESMSSSARRSSRPGSSTVRSIAVAARGAACLKPFAVMTTSLPSSSAAGGAAAAFAFAARGTRPGSAMPPYGWLGRRLLLRCAKGGVVPSGRARLLSSVGSTAASPSRFCGTAAAAAKRGLRRRGTAAAEAAAAGAATLSEAALVVLASATSSSSSSATASNAVIIEPPIELLPKSASSVLSSSTSSSSSSSPIHLANGVGWRSATGSMPSIEYRRRERCDGIGVRLVTGLRLLNSLTLGEPHCTPRGRCERARGALRMLRTSVAGLRCAGDTLLWTSGDAGNAAAAAEAADDDDATGDALRSSSPSTSSSLALSSLSLIASMRALTVPGDAVWRDRYAAGRAAAAAGESASESDSSDVPAASINMRRSVPGDAVLRLCFCAAAAASEDDSAPPRPIMSRTSLRSAVWSSSSSSSSSAAAAGDLALCATAARAARRGEARTAIFFAADDDAKPNFPGLRSRAFLLEFPFSSPRGERGIDCIYRGSLAPRFLTGIKKSF